MHQIKVKNGTFVKFVATLYVKKFGIWWQSKNYSDDSIQKIEDKIEEWKLEHPGTEVSWKKGLLD